MIDRNMKFRINFYQNIGEINIIATNARIFHPIRLIENFIRVFVAKIVKEPIFFQRRLIG